MLKLYNTLTRKKEDFEPILKKTVKMYSCGPTVYDFAHIGNLRTYVFVDILRRTFLYNGYDVKHVMNITDVGHLTEDDREEDKIEIRARREKKTAWDLAKFYEKAFLKDLGELNILTPSVIARATAHITEQINLIKILETKGYTYQINDGIYFDVSKLRDYGKLSGQSLESKQAGARVGVIGEKRNPADFALWKSSPKGSKRSMEWDSSWGKGFPGWHLECSAMSVKYLGQPFDVHTGGIDHIGTHHTNEIAQSEAANGKSLANFWMHSEFLTVNGGRMGKSEGNLIAIKELEDKGFDPLAYRYLALGAHWRSQLNFTWESLRAAQNTLDSIQGKLRYWDKPKGASVKKYEEKFLSAINNDLDIPEALALLHELIEDERYPTHQRSVVILNFDKIFGLNFKNYIAKPISLSQAVAKTINEREDARRRKDWKKADELRGKVEKAGFLVEDTEDGPRVLKKRFV